MEFTAVGQERRTGGTSRLVAGAAEDRNGAGGKLAGTLWTTDLQKAALRPTEWLREGHRARESVTLLPSQCKMGKTALLARMKADGELAGQAVQAGRVVSAPDRHCVGGSHD